MAKEWKMGGKINRILHGNILDGKLRAGVISV
jgi:hypothetical protein